MDEDVVSFDIFDECPGWDKAPEWVLGVIDKYNCHNILEIGSGANPSLAPDIISRRGLHYVANDINLEELTKADPVFERWVGDVSQGIPEHMQSRFDLVFSRMVNEHVVDGYAYHSNINKLLAPGGISAHC